MICNSCKNEFDNISGLKFCPYCGKEIEETTPMKYEEPNREECTEENDKFEEISEEHKKLQDTLKMPAITKKDIRKYKREKFLDSIKKPFTNIKVVISLVTIVFIMAIAIFSYNFLNGRPVDEARIKEDLIGKAFVLPKGTNIDIKNGNIKSFNINSRNTSKSDKKDDIVAAITINNGKLEVNALLAFQYIYDGKGQWKIADKLELQGDVAVKPAVMMEDNELLTGLKQVNITIGDTTKNLGGDDIKKLNIISRNTALDELKDEVLVEVGIDNGIVASTGKIKCNLNFENETWTITSVERNSNDDFVLSLSPNFSDEAIIELIKKDSLDEVVSHSSVFGGKGFYFKDVFTKGITISNKNFDAQSGKLTITAKRNNVAGEIKTTLSTDYTFAISFTKVELLKKSKIVVDAVSVSDISKDIIVSTITNAEIEGENLFFLFSDNHKITAEEAKTFKVNKTLSRKGFQNVKYVNGSITYTESKKQKTISVVATYFLVYDNSKGYSWKLDKVIGEDSPSYKAYTSDIQ